MSKPRKFSSLKNLDLDLADLQEELVDHGGGQRLFGLIELERIMNDLENRGVITFLRSRGYQSLHPVLDRPDPYQERFRLLGSHPNRPGEELLLMDLRARRGELEIPERGSTVALVWDWLQLQDPVREFTRRPLPGQDHPGLGLFKELTQLMLEYVRETRVEALVNVPEFYHNAVLYAPLYKFFDPEREGWFQALRRDLKELGLADASFAVEEGRVFGQDGRPIEWGPSEQVYAVSGAPLEYFQSGAYKSRAEAASQQHRFTYAGEKLPGGKNPSISV